MGESTTRHDTTTRHGSFLPRCWHLRRTRDYSAQAEKAAASELSLWDRRLPAHLRLGAEFGLRREEQSSLQKSELQKLQRHAEGAAATAVAVRGGIRKSASVPALLTAMRHRHPPLLKPLVRAARY